MIARSVTVIVPLGRERFLSNVVRNFFQQREPNKYLVIVENGTAIGACRRAGVCPTAVVTSEASPGLARNAGLEWVREHDGGFVAFFDDDDYYGPDYLSETLAASAKGNVIGKSSFYVRTAAGELRFFENEGEEREVGFLVGPTVATWSEDAAEFKAIPIGEDVAWQEVMEEIGAVFYATSRFHFMLRRYACPSHRHAWNISDFQMAQATKFPVYDVGKEDLDVVEGRKPEPERNLVPKREFRPWHHPGWAVAQRGFSHGR